MPSTRSDSLVALTDDRYPMRKTFFGCCAWAGKPVSRRIVSSRQINTKIFLVIRFSSVLLLLTAHHSLLFDDFIRSRQDVLWNRESDLLGGFEINDKLKLRRLFHWQIGGLGAFEDLINVSGSAVDHIKEVRAVGHEPTCVYQHPIWIHRRE